LTIFPASQIILYGTNNGFIRSCGKPKKMGKCTLQP
jgi:hypothetical protein